MFGGSKFSTKCKQACKCIRVRVDPIRKRKMAMVRFLRKDVADLLAKSLPQRAFDRMDALIVEMNQAWCYDMLDQFCQYLLKQLQYLQKQQECPSEARESLSTIIFAAARFPDLPELCELRQLFTQKYGSQIESFVSQEFVWRLETKSFPKETKQQAMSDIAEEFSVSFDPKSLEKTLSGAHGDHGPLKNFPPLKREVISSISDKHRANSYDEIVKPAEAEIFKKHEVKLQPKEAPESKHNVIRSCSDAKLSAEKVEPHYDRRYLSDNGRRDYHNYDINEGPQFDDQRHHRAHNTREDNASEDMHAVGSSRYSKDNKIPSTHAKQKHRSGDCAEEDTATRPGFRRNASTSFREAPMAKLGSDNSYSTYELGTKLRIPEESTNVKVSHWATRREDRREDPAERRPNKSDFPEQTIRSEEESIDNLGLLKPVNGENSATKPGFRRNVNTSFREAPMAKLGSDSSHSTSELGSSLRHPEECTNVKVSPWATKREDRREDSAERRPKKFDFPEQTIRSEEESIDNHGLLKPVNGPTTRVAPPYYKARSFNEGSLEVENRKHSLFDPTPSNAGFASAMKERRAGGPDCPELERKVMPPPPYVRTNSSLRAKRDGPAVQLPVGNDTGDAGEALEVKNVEYPRPMSVRRRNDKVCLDEDEAACKTPLSNRRCSNNVDPLYEDDYGQKHRRTEQRGGAAKHLSVSKDKVNAGEDIRAVNVEYPRPTSVRRGNANMHLDGEAVACQTANRGMGSNIVGATYEDDYEQKRSRSEQRLGDTACKTTDQTPETHIPTSQKKNCWKQSHRPDDGTSTRNYDQELLNICQKKDDDDQDSAIYFGKLLHKEANRSSRRQRSRGVDLGSRAPDEGEGAGREPTGLRMPYGRQCDEEERRMEKLLVRLATEPRKNRQHHGDKGGPQPPARAVSLPTESIEAAGIARGPSRVQLDHHHGSWGIVHEGLPDYDQLAARMQSLRSK